MDDVAGLVAERSVEEGGRFGLNVGECTDDDFNPRFLTALEDGAKHGREQAMRQLEGVYQLDHSQLTGNISVMPGHTDGANRVGVYLNSMESDFGVRPHAEVRSRWIADNCEADRPPAENAVALAASMVRLAMIPGQVTVSMFADDETVRPLDVLPSYVRIFEPGQHQVA